MVVIREKAAVLDAALVLDRVCYYWSITLDPESAFAFAERCQEMNAATNAALTYLIQSVNACIPTINFGPDNPNTGRMHHDFVIGCENSRFVDVKIHKSYLRHWTNGDWQMLGRSLARLGQELHADLNRIITDDKDEYLYGYWWD